MEKAYNAAAADAEQMAAEPVPMNIRNAPTRLMREVGYGKGYIYAHDTKEKVARMTCLPDSIKDRRYYLPTGLGAEAKFKERAESLRAWREGAEPAE
jgi:putative ATPase